MIDSPGGDAAKRKKAKVKVKVHVTVGIGMWKTSESLSLAACPHIGDFIEVKGVSVTCERVTITGNDVYVEQTIRFNSGEEANEYFR